MGAPVYRFDVGDLPDGEGSVYLLEQSWEEPKKEEAFAKNIFEDEQHRGMGFIKIFHEPCGHGLETIKLSPTKRVLVCRYCLLRLVVPANISTVNDLKEFISNT